MTIIELARLSEDDARLSLATGWPSPSSVHDSLRSWSSGSLQISELCLQRL